MFDPWAFIGWVVAGFLALVLLAIAAGAVAGMVTGLKMRRQRLRSQNIPPRKGQRWQQDNGVLNIIGVSDDGRVHVRTDGYSCYASWVDTPEEWRERVRNRGLILIEEGPGRG